MQLFTHAVTCFTYLTCPTSTEPHRDAMDVAEQLQLLDRRVAYLEELTAHKEAVTDEFSEVVEFPK